MDPTPRIDDGALRGPVTSQISYLPVTGYGEQPPLASVQQSVLWLMQLDWSAVKSLVVDAGALWVLDQTFDAVRDRALEAYRARHMRERAELEQRAGVPAALPPEVRQSMVPLAAWGTQPIYADPDTQALLAGLVDAAVRLWPDAPGDLNQPQEWSTASLRSYGPSSAVWLLVSGPIAAVVDLSRDGPDVSLTDMRTGR